MEAEEVVVAAGKERGREVVKGGRRNDVFVIGSCDIQFVSKTLRITCRVSHHKSNSTD